MGIRFIRPEFRENKLKQMLVHLVVDAWVGAGILAGVQAALFLPLGCLGVQLHHQFAQV